MKLRRLIKIIVGIAIIVVIGFYSKERVKNFDLFNSISGNKYQTVNANQYSNNNNQENENANLILVNKNNAIDENYKPKDLVKPYIRFLSTTEDEEKYMKKNAAQALENLVNTASQEGITLIGSSAYRSYQKQSAIVEKYTKKNGKEYAKNYVAKPGESEHQTGLAIDLTNQTRCFDVKSKEAIWLKENCYRFGFILRYPEGKENITGYNSEPWHIRYVGNKAAREINSKDITLEEYLGSN